MEMLIIAVVAVIAFGAALYPLVKGRGPSAADADEFAGPEAASTDPAARAPKPVRVERPGAGAGETGAPGHAVHPPEADVVTGEGIVPPMAAGPATPVAPVGLPEPGTVAGDDPVEREVARYRVALRAGTICRKCGEANPPESRFCAECGTALPLGESHEFG